MKELQSKVPADCPVDVKNVKTLDTSDGYAMTATLYWNGKRIGRVENNGNGGSNDYDAWEIERDDVAGSYARFRETMDEVHAYANEWLGEPDDRVGMNLDLLIEEIMQEKDIAREVRKEIKRGVEFVAVAHEGPYWYPDDEDRPLGDNDREGEGEPDGYEATYIVTAPSREAFLRQAEGRGIDSYRVLHEAVDGVSAELTVEQQVEAAVAEARELRAKGVGGPCPHCGVKMRREAGREYRNDYDTYASGSHSAGYEAAFTGEVICCFHCGLPLGRRAGFLSCPEHGWDCGSGSIFHDTRRRVKIEASDG